VYKHVAPKKQKGKAILTGVALRAGGGTVTQGTIFFRGTEVIIFT